MDELTQSLSTLGTVGIFVKIGLDLFREAMQRREMRETRADATLMREAIERGNRQRERRNTTEILIAMETMSHDGQRRALELIEAAEADFPGVTVEAQKLNKSGGGS